MPKPTAIHATKLINLLTSLQRHLRLKIKKSPPLRVVEIKNDFSQHTDFLQLLMRGIAGPDQSYIRLGAGPEIGDIIAFAPTPEALGAGITALREIIPEIFALIEELRAPSKNNSRSRPADPMPNQLGPDHQLAMVGPLICTLAEIAKSNHPRARSLPKIITGPITYQPNGRLKFPTARSLTGDAVNPDLWNQIQTSLNHNPPAIRMLDKPVVESAAKIINQMLLSLTPVKKRLPKKLATSKNI
jgi:hypothetical protein